MPSSNWIDYFLIFIMILAAFSIGRYTNNLGVWVCYYDIPSYDIVGEIKQVCYIDINETDCYAKTCVYRGRAVVDKYTFSQFVINQYNISFVQNN